MTLDCHCYSQHIRGFYKSVLHVTLTVVIRLLIEQVTVVSRGMHCVSRQNSLACNWAAATVSTEP